MERNLILFDVDGTLVDVSGAQEYIPQSAIDAIHAARAKGNLCFLCTGRSKAEIYPYILDVGFDGIIGAGGGFVEIGGEMLYHKRVTTEQIFHVVDFFEANGFDYYIESNGGLYASARLVPRLERIKYGDLEHDPEARRKKAETPSQFIESLITGQDLHRDDVNKICFLEQPGVPWQRVHDEFEREFKVIPCTVPHFGKESGELTVPGVSKASAIEALLAHLNIPRANTYAFGDGKNDSDMLEYCAHGIAAGNACDALKAIADEVTAPIWEDGIAQAMARHGLV